MKAKDLIAALEKLNPDEEVKIVEDESRTDRYGEAYGLKVGNEILAVEYFGHECPSW